MKPMTREQAGVGEEVGDGSDTYLVNEVFYTLQGEGALWGTPMVFVRLAKCNLRCAVHNVGFDCDTDFQGGAATSMDDLVETVKKAHGEAACQWVLCTGGEPALQLDQRLVDALHHHGYKVAVETNGTVKVGGLGLDWVCVSPKTAEHTIRQRECDEVKVVRGHGQHLPELTAVTADHWWVSPRWQPDGGLDPQDAAWCVELVKQNPGWRLSLQTHKMLGIR